MFEIRPSAVLGPFSFDQCCVLLGIMFVLISIFERASARGRYSYGR